jgi:hypothetical protein
VQLKGREPYQIKVQVGEVFMLTNEAKEAKHGYCRWSERIEEISSFDQNGKSYTLTDFSMSDKDKKREASCVKLPYTDVRMIGHVFVYLMKGN